MEWVEKKTGGPDRDDTHVDWGNNGSVSGHTHHGDGVDNIVLTDRDLDVLNGCGNGRYEDLPLLMVYC